MQVVFADPISALQYVSAGTLVALAVTSKERSPVAPSVPTISESGYPGFDAIARHGILAPANTPPAIIRKLNAEIVAALKDLETKALLRETDDADRRQFAGGVCEFHHAGYRGLEGSGGSGPD